MTLIRGVNGLFPCPVCLVPADKQSELGVAPLYPLRNQEQARSIVMNASLSNNQKDKELKKIGARNVVVSCGPFMRTDSDNVVECALERRR